MLFIYWKAFESLTSGLWDFLPAIELSVIIIFSYFMQTVNKNKPDCFQYNFSRRKSVFLHGVFKHINGKSNSAIMIQ